MNRKYKFRGKEYYPLTNEDGKEWRYGSLLEFTNEVDGSITAIVDEYGCSTEVHYKSVGQYTELTDKNDVEIYGGDIYKIYSDEFEEDILYKVVLFKEAMSSKV